ncbi:ABC transporter permease subunit [Sphaerisporangium sp. NPDC051011]|uniref:ABC transporter permease subunit n=1 Tax=Sphaerisporangium sp. NPDC051011 TaxID=3155792 RepID=UPI0034012770
MRRDTDSARPRGWGALALPAVLFVTVVYVVPLVMLLVRSVAGEEFGFGNYARLLGGSGFLEVLKNTALLSLVSAILCVLIGFPVAFTIARARGMFRAFLYICVVAPYLTSVLIRVFAIQVLLGSQGIINNALAALGFERADLLFNSFAVIVGLVHSQIPIVVLVLVLVPVIEKVDVSRVLAARSMGAGPAEAFVRVFLPATRPGLQVAFVLSLVYSAGSFAVPELLGGNSAGMAGSFIYGAVSEEGDTASAAAASVILSAAILVVLLLFTLLTRQKIQSVVAPQLMTALATDGPAERPERGRRPRLPWRRATHRYARRSIAGVAARLLDRSRLSYVPGIVPGIATVLAILVLLPQLLAIPISFAGTRALVFPPHSYSTQWYANMFTSSWLVPLWVSIVVGLVSAVCATALGTLAAIAIGRTRSKALRAVSLPYLLVPLLFPVVVAANAFFIGFLRVGLVDTQAGFILAHISITLPQAFIIGFAGVQALNPDYENAAASLGASRLKTMRRILLPLLAGQVLVSLFLTFVTSFDESTIAIFLSGINVQTLPNRIFQALALQTDPTVGVAAVLFMAFASVVALGWQVLKRRRTRTTVRSGSTKDL